ncbi:MAG: threonine synthase [Clostridia bacterium]|nr:threonine synthase [Clostridia bacterium]
MNYFSTRDTERKIAKTSAEVIKQGIADDGGLFMPESIPEIDLDYIKSLCDKTYIERAAEVLSLYLTDYTKEELMKAASAAYAEDKFIGGAAPVIALGNDIRVLELWHGPTCAFKDMALQIMPRLLSMALDKTGEKRQAVILVATSGDTGKAALEGYCDVDRVKICVFYPNDGVSDMQKLQMASQKGDNVYVCAINGNFDDAQTGVKKIFSDKAIADKLNEKGFFLSSANSINWGRLAPQIVYYISAYCDLVSEGDIKLGEQIDIAVPTGNFGNIFAAYLAKRMGLPVRNLICASNKNNILTDFLETGTYDRNREFYTTMSPSMDILISSNLERLLYCVAGAEKVKGYMSALSADGKYTVEPEIFSEIKKNLLGFYSDEEKTAKTIKTIFDKYSYIVDPHTAVGIGAAVDACKNDGVKVVTASTASPYKFPYDVIESLGDTASENAFECLDKLSELTGTEIPAPLANLRSASVRFKETVGKETEQLWEAAERFITK